MRGRSMDDAMLIEFKCNSNTTVFRKTKTINKKNCRIAHWKTAPLQQSANPTGLK